MENISRKEEIEMLLPLYATGKLSEDEWKMVEAYLEEHPDMTMQLALIDAERDANISAHENLGTLSPKVLTRIHARLDALEGEAAQTKPSFVATIQHFLTQLIDIQTGVGKFAAAAAVFLIIIQGIIIGSLTLQPAGRFETASGEKTIQTVQGTALLIAFQDNANIGDIISLVTEFDATIISGPTEEGFLTLKISDKILPAEQVEKIIEKLESKDTLVQFVTLAE